MKSAKHIILACFICISLDFSTAISKQVDPQTKDMLDTIIAGHRSNRAKITDLSMSGSILILHGKDEGHIRAAEPYPPRGQRFSHDLREELRPGKGFLLCLRAWWHPPVKKLFSGFHTSGCHFVK